MSAARRVASPGFFKNRPLSRTPASGVLRAIRDHPTAGNRDLSALTGLGVTDKDENDGVLPTYLGYLSAMGLISSPQGAVAARNITARGHVVLKFDEFMQRPATTVLMALGVCEEG